MIRQRHLIAMAAMGLASVSVNSAFAAARIPTAPITTATYTQVVQSVGLIVPPVIAVPVAAPAPVSEPVPVVTSPVVTPISTVTPTPVPVAPTPIAADTTISTETVDDTVVAVAGPVRPPPRSPYRPPPRPPF